MPDCINAGVELYELLLKKLSLYQRDKTTWQAVCLVKESNNFIKVVHDYAHTKKSFVGWKRRHSHPLLRCIYQRLPQV